MATGDLIGFEILNSSALPNGGNIDGNGVIARIRLEGLAANIGGAYDLSKLTGTGASPGWNRAKTYSTTNTPRAVALTEKIARRPFPSETLRIEAAVGADLDIYAYLTEEWFVADTLTSVSIAAGFYAGSTVSTLTGAGLLNSSTRAYEMPQISWVGLEPWRRMTGSGLTVEAIIDHHNARDRQPVPAVDFYITRSAVTSTASTNAVVLSDEVTAPYRPGVYRATVPIGSLSQGEGDLGAIIYPWVGNATWDTNSANFETFPCTGTPKLYPVNIDTDGSYAPAGGYVSHTGATIGSPTIGLLSAMGAYVPGTTPAFASIAAVAQATRAWNNNAANRARPHDDMAGVFAVIPSGVIVGTWGTVSIASQTTFPPGLGFFGITAEAGASRTNTGLTTNARTHPSRLLLSNLGVFPGAAGGATHTVTDGLTGTPTSQPTKAAAIYLAVRGCTGTGNNDNSFPVFWRSGYVWHHNNSFTSFGDDLAANNSGQFNGTVHLHGCTIDNSANTGRVNCQSASVIGCALYGVALNGLATGAAPDILGRMVHSVRVDANEGTIAGYTMAVIGSRAVGVRGESWVNVLLRKTSSTVYAGALSVTSPTLQISADFGAGPVDQPAITNINMAYLSCAGGRWNGPYNEAATTRVLKEVRQIGIAAHQMNTKADVFPSAPAASGNRTGTFAYRFGNARFGIVTGDTSANADAAPGPAAWLGDALPPLSQNNVGYGSLWANDTSFPGGNNYASAGDYAPAAALFNRIPAGRAAAAFDLAGNPRLNNGTGAAGAIERAIVGVTVDLAGAASGLASAAAGLSLAKSLAGAARGLASAAAGLSLAKSLAGAGAVTSTAVSALSLIKPLSGAAGCMATATGFNDLAVNLGGAGSGAASGSATLTISTSTPARPPAQRIKAILLPTRSYKITL